MVSQCVPTKTAYKTPIHNMSETVRLIMEYSAVIESNAVKAPGPAYIGKARGTMEPEPDKSLDLKIVISKIISNAMRKITNPPAIAKYSICTPKSLRIHSPANKNAMRMMKLARQTLKKFIYFVRTIIYGDDDRVFHIVG